MNQALKARPMNEHTFTTHDGEALFYRHWPAMTEAAKGAIVLFHRGHEHSGRMRHVVQELGMPEYDFFAWDARGHGMSPGERGFSPSIGDSIRDIQTFMQHLQAQHGFALADIAVIAQSVGAVLVSAWVHDYAPILRALVLASPAFKVKLYVPLALPAIRLCQAIKGPFFVNSYVKPQYLTHDPERVRSYRQDDLITRPIASHILLGLYETAERVVADAAAITTPTQLLISGSDWVVHQTPQHRFYENLGSPIKERHLLPGFFHDTLGEAERGPVFEKMRGFIDERFEQPLFRPNLREADTCGHTRREADRLASPLPLTSWRGVYWAAMRQSMTLGARLSEGVRLGCETGFDSGSTLDYVYENRPRGRGLIGRAIDRGYLNAIGWRGIRQRKVHLEALIARAAAELHTAGRPLRMLDVAAGHGRYILDAVARLPAQPDAVELRDYSALNVRKGQQLIESRGLQHLCRFVQADAFDPDSYPAADAGPTLGVISGLFELFPDNAPINRALAGMAQSLPSGGYLVYTGQPWHPQLEMIARSLTSHRDGQAWVMRRRTQAELDQLVEEAGFTKIEQLIDQHGIFTVSLARRV